MQDVPPNCRTVDLTTLVVGERVKADGKQDQPTLLELATQYCAVSLKELRDLNPCLNGVGAAEPIPLGQRVRLPLVLPDQRNLETIAGGTHFRIGEAEERLLRCRDRLDECVRRYEHAKGSCLPPLPHRRVRTVIEQVRDVIDAEVERQLPGVEARCAELTNCVTVPPTFVEADVVVQEQKRITEKFASEIASVGSVLHSFKPANAVTLSAATGPSSSRLDSKLSPIHMRPIQDVEEDACAQHTHRWEFTVCRSNTLRAHAELAFLSCQRLTTLFDTLQSTCVSENAHGYPFPLSRDGFLYLSGTFYIDDRHEGFVDLTKSIRHFSMPLNESSRGVDDGGDGSAGNAFKHCRVVGASSVRWRDVCLRQGELCALRHLGGCTHFFYLSGVKDLRCTATATPAAPSPHARLSRSPYPLCIAKAEEPALPCQLCRLYPSTMALYGDALSPTTPAVYCHLCFQLLHGVESSDKAEANAFLTMVAEDPGNYFRSVE